jgi:hypothetical protein
MVEGSTVRIEDISTVLGSALGKNNTLTSLNISCKILNRSL